MARHTLSAAKNLRVLISTFPVHSRLLFFVVVLVCVRVCVRVCVSSSPDPLPKF